DREEERRARRRVPRTPEAPASRGLLVRCDDCSLRCAVEQPLRRRAALDERERLAEAAAGLELHALTRLGASCNRHAARAVQSTVSCGLPGPSSTRGSAIQPWSRARRT